MYNDLGRGSLRSVSAFTSEGRLFLPDTDRQIANVRCTIFLRKPSRRERGKWGGTLIIVREREEFQKMHPASTNLS